MTKEQWKDPQTRAKELIKAYRKAARPPEPVRSDLIKRIGQDLREKRKARKWTAAQLSEATGIDTAYLLRIEQGKINVTIETLEKIGQALNHRIGVEFVRNKKEE